MPKYKLLHSTVRHIPEPLWETIRLTARHLEIPVSALVIAILEEYVIKHHYQIFESIKESFKDK